MHFLGRSKLKQRPFSAMAVLDGDNNNNNNRKTSQGIFLPWKRNEGKGWPWRIVRAHRRQQPRSPDLQRWAWNCRRHRFHLVRIQWDIDGSAADVRRSKPTTLFYCFRDMLSISLEIQANHPRDLSTQGKEWGQRKPNSLRLTTLHFKRLKVQYTMIGNLWTAVQCSNWYSHICWSCTRTLVGTRSGKKPKSSFYPGKGMRAKEAELIAANNPALQTFKGES